MEEVLVWFDVNEVIWREWRGSNGIGDVWVGKEGIGGTRGGEAEGEGLGELVDEAFGGVAVGGGRVGGEDGGEAVGGGEV